LDAGLVTVAEVGEIKKELAYHGDVLNTASRIQGMCNQLDARLLISERLRNRLTWDGQDFELLGDIKLKGKEESVRIYKWSGPSH
jgi:adenylate cyclase